MFWNNKQNMLGILLAGKSQVLLKMKCTVGCNMVAFRVCPTWQILVTSIFSFKIQFVEMSTKRKQVQSSLNSFFGGKHDQEINTTPTMPTKALTKRAQKFQELWKVRYKWLQFDEKENKMFCKFCREFPKAKNTQYSLTIVTNNF